MINDNLRIAVFADRDIGINTLRYLFKNYGHHVKAICGIDETSSVIDYSRNIGFNNVMTWNDIKASRGDRLKLLELDYILLAWWPYILDKEIISIPKIGILNFHPSLLPYNAGKDANFWTIIEDCPFGVTLMLIDEGIDSGDILFQKEIEKSWEDTGETLYEKEIHAMYELFCESYPKIIRGEYERHKNHREDGSFHYRREMLEKVHLKLDDIYSVRDLLNLLRAKTFTPYKGCWFQDNEEKYEVRISINQIKEP